MTHALTVHFESVGWLVGWLVLQSTTASSLNTESVLCYNLQPPPGILPEHNHQPCPPPNRHPPRAPRPSSAPPGQRCGGYPCGPHDPRPARYAARGLPAPGPWLVGARRACWAATCVQAVQGGSRGGRGRRRAQPVTQDGRHQRGSTLHPWAAGLCVEGGALQACVGCV